jgi:hypothetical protein
MKLGNFILCIFYHHKKSKEREGRKEERKEGRISEKEERKREKKEGKGRGREGMSYQVVQN